MNWCTNNDMVVNVPKTRAMLISTRYKINQIMTNPPKLNIGDETIELTTNEKLLGIYIVMFSFIAFRRNINYLSSKLLIWENPGIKHQKTLPDMVYINQF